MRSVLPPVLALLLAAPVHAADYVQAPGSSLVFAGTYQGEAFTGHFPGFRTRISFDPDAPAAGRLEVAIPLANVTTGNPDYDGEVRGATFFNVARFAEARYTAEGFRALGDGRYAADGVLSLRGVEHPVTLAFTWTDGPQPTLAGSATVNRLDFEVGGGVWQDTSVIPNEIAIRTRVVFRTAP